MLLTEVGGLGTLPQRHLQHPGPQRQPAHQRAPGAQLGVGQGDKSVQGGRAGSLTVKGGHTPRLSSCDGAALGFLD